MESFLCSGCHQPNTMVLRILVLLLLCLSLGMGATLGFYQTQAGEGGPRAGNTIMDTSSLESPEQETVVEKPLDKENAAKSETAESRAAEDFIVETLDGNEIVVKMPAVDSLKEDTAMAQDPMAATKAMMGLLPPASKIREVTQGETGMSVEYSRWSSLRGSVEAISGYFDTLVELVGGHNGVCQYRCQYGVLPQPRPGYQVAQPNGCSSSLVGLQLDLGIPAMRECCNQLDLCYDTCGESKSHCDSIFRRCLHSICFDLKKTLGFVSQVHACESMADGLYSTVGTLGCRPYMNSQRAACICEGEDRDEL